MYYLGVRLFGRELKQGMNIEYAPLVKRRGNSNGPGGLAGVTESLLLGSIKMIYELTMTGSGPNTCVLVEISEIPFETKVRGLYIVRSQLPGPPPGHHHLYTPNNTLIHIDAITHRVMMVQHYDRNKMDEYMCGIPMWKAR